MKALIKREAAPGLWLEEVEIPKIGDFDVLVKVHKTAICGTDLHLYQWNEWSQKTLSVPTIIGHEFVGEIVEVGKQVQNFKTGERVSGEGHITCGVCRNCRIGKKHLCANTLGLGIHRHGCFAEYFAFPQDNLFSIPDNISDDIAAIMDPLGNAVHTALSFDVTGEDVLITGAGPIGLMASSIVHHAGARNAVITDFNEYRLELARKMNSASVIDIQKVSLKEAMKSIPDLKGFDVALEMSGSPQALRDIIDNCTCGAHIALLGLLPSHALIDWDKVIFKGLFLKGIYGREIFNTWYKMAHLLDRGLDFSPIITHRYSFEGYEKAFNVALSGQCGKVILEWT